MQQTYTEQTMQYFKFQMHGRTRPQRLLHFIFFIF